MRAKVYSLCLVLASIIWFHQAAAQGQRFFRISGPAATTITAFNPDGTLVWNNALVGMNYTVQTVTALPGSSNWVDYVKIPTTNGVNTNRLTDLNPPAGMALIPAGVFTIGDTLDGDFHALPTNVYVSAFYMDVNLVSLSQWQSVYIWAATNGYAFADAGSGKAANHPVQTVDWYDCVKWSNARSQQTGLTPAYYTDAGLTQVYTNGETTNVFANWAVSGYRLPTEAEWEKAARSGLSGQRFPWGNTITESQANYYANTNISFDLGPNSFNAAFTNGGFPYTSPVGSFTANGYGLYDMAGNVYEWCWDWYASPTYPTGSPYLGGSDPRGPASGSGRVFRGGDWDDQAFYARCASRGTGLTPVDAFFNFGFRCVRGSS